MLSKAEMEQMWQTGAVGCLKSHNKYRKSHKLFKIELLPYRTEVMYFKDHKQICEVYARNSADAILNAKSKFYAQVHKDLKFSSIQVKVLP